MPAGEFRTSGLVFTLITDRACAASKNRLALDSVVRKNRMNTPIELFSLCRVIYLHAIRSHTHSAFRSLGMIERICNTHSSKLHDRAVQRHNLDQMQNVIEQAGAISRYFWPADNKHAGRGQFLRIIFEIEDDDPLSDCSLRNSLEHYDEYLDKLFSRPNAGEYIPDYFSPKLDLNQGFRYFLRAYFPDTNEFIVLGKSHRVQPIAESIGRINESLLQLL